MVRTINIVFSDFEFKRINKAKRLHNCKTWRDYMFLPVAKVEEQK
jgi:hypothetical protein